MNTYYEPQVELSACAIAFLMNSTDESKTISQESADYYCKIGWLQKQGDVYTLPNEKVVNTNE